MQFNLFAGSILGLGCNDQIAALEAMQARGDLGCFGLTEVDAGVMLGLIVETTATWHETYGGHFVIHTPHAGAAKNWISQGMVANWMVVIARLLIGGKYHGPHPFIVPMRREGRLLAGIRAGDMGVRRVAAFSPARQNAKSGRQLARLTSGVPFAHRSRPLRTTWTMRASASISYAPRAKPSCAASPE